MSEASPCFFASLRKKTEESCTTIASKDQDVAKRTLQETRVELQCRYGCLPQAPHQDQATDRSPEHRVRWQTGDHQRMPSAQPRSTFIDTYTAPGEAETLTVAKAVLVCAALYSLDNQWITFPCCQSSNGAGTFTAHTKRNLS